MERSASRQDHHVGATFGAFLTLLLSACTAQQVTSSSQQQFAPAEQMIANPLLQQFMAICSMALNDATASYQVARNAGWEALGAGDSSMQMFRLGGGALRGGFDLSIVNAHQSDSPGAARCAVLGISVTPALMQGLDTFGIPGYVATNDTGSPGIKRRLKGTASFGDPILIELTAAAAQGTAVIDLSMTNLAKPLPLGRN
jgi:hypothetical protein